MGSGIQECNFAEDIWNGTTNIPINYKNMNASNDQKRWWKFLSLLAKKFIVLIFPGIHCMANSLLFRPTIPDFLTSKESLLIFYLLKCWYLTLQIITVLEVTTVVGKPPQYFVKYIFYKIKSTITRFQTVNSQMWWPIVRKLWRNFE